VLKLTRMDNIVPLQKPVLNPKLLAA